MILNNITVAVTGHRDMVESEKLKEEIVRFFQELLQKYGTVTLLSPLAEGGDQYAAALFLEQGNHSSKTRLQVPLPFDEGRYMDGMGKEAAASFLELSRKADEVWTIPETDSDPYRNLGHYLVDHCDILLCLWDGTYNHKVGGTGDTVAYAQERNRKTVHLHTARKI